MFNCMSFVDTSKISHVAVLEASQSTDHSVSTAAAAAVSFISASAILSRSRAQHITGIILLTIPSAVALLKSHYEREEVTQKMTKRLKLEAETGEKSVRGCINIKK